MYLFESREVHTSVDELGDGEAVKEFRMYRGKKSTQHQAASSQAPISIDAVAPEDDSIVLLSEINSRQLDSETL